MTTPHATSLRRLYEFWTAGDSGALSREFSPKLTFEIKGQSSIAGKYDLTQLTLLSSRMKELSGNTFQSEIHDMLVSDRHGMVLATHTLFRDGKKMEYRSVQVWRFENGLPIAGYEYLRDQYLFDQIWK